VEGGGEGWRVEGKGRREEEGGKGGVGDRLVDFVVTVTAIADYVHDDVLAEFLAPFPGTKRRMRREEEKDEEGEEEG
jgi:hypothetical protein